MDGEIAVHGKSPTMPESVMLTCREDTGITVFSSIRGEWKHRKYTAEEAEKLPDEFLRNRLDELLRYERGARPDAGGGGGRRRRRRMEREIGKPAGAGGCGKCIRAHGGSCWYHAEAARARRAGRP